MKKSLLLLFLAFTISFSFGQDVKGEPRPFIDVTGKAELKIVPDEIYISISLRERTVNKKVWTIDQQEEQLTKNLTANGLDTENLFLGDADSDLLYRKIRKDQSILSKSFQFKAKDAVEVTKLFEILDEMEIDGSSVQSVDHSKRDSLQKVVRIMAIKAAKEKAEYLLEAIGSSVGPPLEVKEVTSNGSRSNLNLNTNLNYSNSNEVIGYRYSSLDLSIQYEKIIIYAMYYTKFLIE